MQTTTEARTGNRCGHNPQRPRLCDLSRRGKGGHPPIIGVISSLLTRSYADRTLLSTWHRLNPSGRRRRSERREVMTSLAQYLFAQWFQVETRRCATPGGFFLQVPDIAHLARRIARSDEWGGQRLSVGRITAVFSEWEKSGYITSHQQREQKPSGEWVAAPAIRTFTKKFFVELGGQRLWNAVKKSGARKLKKIQAYIDAQGIRLRDYLRPGKPVSPRTANRLRVHQGNPPQFPFHRRKPVIDRESAEYQRIFSDKIDQLFYQHGPDGPPADRWSPEEIHDNAQRIADAVYLKAFKASALH